MTVADRPTLHRTDMLDLRAPEAKAVLIARWDLPDDAARRQAAEAALAAMPPAPGLLRYSLFNEIEGSALFHLSQWIDQKSLDQYVRVGLAAPKAAVDQAAAISRVWRFLGEPAQTHVVKHAKPGCVVFVRQPMVVPDRSVAISWVASVIEALHSEDGPPKGLLAAQFFTAYDGAAAINMAEWESAQAHKAALRPADFNSYGSLGASKAWRRTRSHPGIASSHEVTRCAFYGSVEP